MKRLSRLPVMSRRGSNGQGERKASPEAFQFFPNGAGDHAFRSGFYQQTEDSKTGFVAQAARSSAADKVSMFPVCSK